MFSLYESTSLACSKLITERYSTSFTLGIKTLDKPLRLPIFAIYGFVRLADEIVDTFHDFDKKTLLERFKKETYQAIEEKISLNPVLHSFQKIVNEYQIEHELIDAFLYSMEMDLKQVAYDSESYNEYIYGSAEVVGLMCLRVFCKEDPALFDSLKTDARSLGAAFQKVNFLRDLKDDYQERGRVYFPDVDFSNFTTSAKKQIEKDILLDFQKAHRGILGLPKSSRRGVYLAYVYYQKLFDKIKQTPAETIQERRIRVPDTIKFLLLIKTFAKQALHIL